MGQRIRHVVVASLTAGVVLCGAAALRGAGGQVHHVPRDYPTIQSAVAAAEEGDTILVATGVYTENVVVSTSGIRLLGGGDVVLDGTGLTGVGLHVLGSAATPVTDVDVSNFEVRNFERGIVVESATDVRVSRNYVHDNYRHNAVVGAGVGIVFLSVEDSDVSHNVISGNGIGGIHLRGSAGSRRNTVHHNRVLENGSQKDPFAWNTLDGDAILLTGPSDDNRIHHNEIVGNHGRGVVMVRPVTGPPISGMLIAHNRVHGNQRAGIAIMFGSTGNTVVHNDARGNNLSRLQPCYDCNLFDNSVGKDGGNFWNKNLGTFSGTDACAP